MNEGKITVSIVENAGDIRGTLRVLINGSAGFESFTFSRMRRRR